MRSLLDRALERGRRAGASLALALLCGCAAGTGPLVLPPGHPADPRTPGADVPVEVAIPAATPPLTDPGPAVAGTHACPMHPEVTSPSPGRCPKCGMRLVPVPAAGAERGR